MSKQLTSITYFMFNKTALYYLNDGIYLKYQLDSRYSFLSFCPETKEFEELEGLGRIEKDYSNWWRSQSWKEMNE